MKCLLIFTLSSLFVTGWNPDWYKAEQLKTQNEKEILKLVSGNYISEYLIMGMAEPKPIKNYTLEISKNGEMCIYFTDVDGNASRELIYDFEIKINNNDGILTIESTLKQQNNTILIAINNNIFSGIFYISKDRSEIMFGNNIEVDGGPASVWVRR